MKKFLALALALIMVLSLVACGGSKKEETKEEVKEETTETTETTEEKTYTLTFTTSSVPAEAHTKTLVEYVGPRLEELSGHFAEQFGLSLSDELDFEEAPSHE